MEPMRSVFCVKMENGDGDGGSSAIDVDGSGHRNDKRRGHLGMVLLKFEFQISLFKQSINYVRVEICFKNTH